MKKVKIKLDDMERRILVKLHKTGSNATDQCWGGIDLLCFGGQLLHIDLAVGITLRIISVPFSRTAANTRPR